MAGNTFGKVFAITTFGESHGPGVGVIIDGCPPGLLLNEEVIQKLMDLRKPGKSIASTTRSETDTARIMSGVFEGKTTGTPIMLLIMNEDSRSEAYFPFAELFRPGHGDITYLTKYGIRDWRGGGRSSGRETAARVAAGAVAKTLLEKHHIHVYSYTLELGGIRAKKRDLSLIHQNPYASPDPDVVSAMDERVRNIKDEGDSLGGIVEVLARGVPAGLGEPVFDKLDAELARAMMSIGAVKGVEIGDGFAVSNKLGSQNNDEITPEGFATNHAGGILAGISNGEDIIIRVGVKPISSIAKIQRTVDINNQPTEISVTGRHDVSAIPRINVVCEAMACIVLADHLLRQKTLA